MATPITRLLTALELLQNQRQLSGAELAQRLDVDRRTVRRYIALLEEMGVPVTTEQGRYGGYSLVPGFKLPPMMFTDEETLAIALGLLAVRQLGLAEATPAIDSVQNKLERVMPTKLKQRVQSVSDTTRLMLPRPTPLLDDRVLITLTRAIQAEQRISFTYQIPDKDTTQREADPYGLVFQSGRWYMSGYCHLRNAMRSFRLDRIAQASLLPQHFQRPADFDAAEHFIQSLNAMPQNYDVSVLLHTDAETAAKAFCFHSNAHALFQPHPDGLLLNTRIDSYEWFARWLAQLNFPFTVMETPELKETLINHARRLVEATSNPMAG